MSDSPVNSDAPQARTVVANRIDFSASIDSFQGPLDLLLYLIKENEVEITEIPIARILEQYLRFLDQAPQWDLQLAGEFLVMATTLMEIKSRDLLPVQQQAADGEEIIEDPRSELVRQLLQYRQLKEQARGLEQLQDNWQQCRPRGMREEIPEDFAPEDAESDRAAAKDALFDVDLYALFAAYERTLKAVLAQTPRNIEYDGESIEAKIERIEGILKSRPFTRFVELIVNPNDRGDIAATFVALLELTRRRAVRLVQAQEFGNIDVNALKEGEAEEHTRREAGEAEATEAETLRVKAVQDAEALAQAAAEGGPKLKWTRRQAKPKFEGLLKPEDLEAIDAEENEIGRRIDAILAAADAISDRFEQSHEGRIRGDETPIGVPALGEIPGAETPPVAPATPIAPAAPATPKIENPPAAQPAAPAEPAAPEQKSEIENSKSETNSNPEN